ncbi:hypothetical protein ACIRD3_19890 [Kitasatospora sp. NPDC093550]|uniref:hypothetical protein n=1 Tax=Kitasatospora sp. NPDC093550 TaxID=3364089 RepID=UPI00380A999B
MSGHALLAVPALHPVPPVAGRVQAFLDYFAGVFTLLSLTAVVVGGLVATDRLLLTPRMRVAVQSAHRATAVAALGFLGVHIAVKVVERHAGPWAAAVPFAGGAGAEVALGTLAADLMVLVAATGVVRGRFAGSRHAWLWRFLHATAYACWPVALAHGLTAGRPAHAWVWWGYGLCAAAVALALLVRTLAGAGRRRAAGLHRRGSRARRPATARTVTFADLAARSSRGDSGGRPLARPVPPADGAAPASASASVGRLPYRPRHAGPATAAVRLARPGGGR